MTGERNTTAWTIEQMLAIRDQKAFGTVQVDDRPVNILDVLGARAPENITDYDLDTLPYLGTVIVDMQTANAIVTLYDALSPDGQQKMLALSVEQAAALAWKCVSRA